MLRTTTTSWGSVSRAFHWILGLAIIGMLAYGWWMNHVVPRPDRFFHRSIHADIGYVLLLLMVIRLLWGGINPVPAPSADASRSERLAGRVGHWALYVTTIAVGAVRLGAFRRQQA